jgi:hypothetical protein
MDEIVDSITKLKFAQKLIIILAGYDADINRLMSINPGLTSRFPEALHFRSLNPEECVRLFTELLQGQKRRLLQRKRDLDITILESPRNEFLQKLLHAFKALSNLPNWANARDIQTLAKDVFGKTIKSATPSQGKLTVDEETIVAGIDAMTAERARRSHIPILDQRSLPSDALQLVLDDRLDSPHAAQTTRSALSVSSQKDCPPPPPPSRDTQATPDNPPRDAGVSDEVWERLQQDKAAAEAHEQEYKQLLEQEAALRESAAVVKRKTESAAAAALEEVARHGTDDEAKRRHEEARLRHELERRACEEELEALKRKRQVKEERFRKEREAQKKLREMGVCSMGYRWIKQAHGYRCAGGSHYVSDAQLGC